MSRAKSHVQKSQSRFRCPQKPSIEILHFSKRQFRSHLRQSGRGSLGFPGVPGGSLGSLGVSGNFQGPRGFPGSQAFQGSLGSLGMEANYIIKNPKPPPTFLHGCDSFHCSRVAPSPNPYPPQERLWRPLILLTVSGSLRSPVVNIAHRFGLASFARRKYCSTFRARFARPS